MFMHVVQTEEDNPSPLQGFSQGLLRLPCSQPSGCMSSQMTGSASAQPRLLSNPSAPAASTGCRDEEEKEEEGTPGGARWVV